MDPALLSRYSTPERQSCSPIGRAEVLRAISKSTAADAATTLYRFRPIFGCRSPQFRAGARGPAAGSGGNLRVDDGRRTRTGSTLL